MGTDRERNMKTLLLLVVAVAQAQKGWKRCKDGLANGRVTSSKNKNDKTEVNCTCDRGYTLVDYQNNPTTTAVKCTNGELQPRVNCAKVIDDTPSTQTPPTYAPPTYAPTMAPTKRPTTTTQWTGQFPQGCPQPIENAIEVEIVDQFLRYDRYGYAIRIRVDQTKNPNPNKRFALALNLHSLSERKGAGNYQTWNLQYWNFYENFVVFQSKSAATSTDINDENSVLLVGENQRTSEIPEILFFGSVNVPHWCFRDSKMSRSHNLTVDDWFKQSKRVKQLEDVVSVRTKGGRPVGVRGWGRKKGGQFFP